MIALLLVAVLVLVLLNAFFVAAEFALVRSRKAHLQTDADEGKKGAATAVNMMDDLSRYLSAAQVGITLTSLGLGFLGEPAIGQLIESAIGEEVPHWISTIVSVALAYLITTSIHITFGEQVPKIYAIQKAETVARVCARPLLIFTKVFSPFISALNAASNAILRVLGVRTAGQLDEGETPEELRVLIQESLTGGKLDAGEAGMLTGVFHLHEQQARQVMTPAPAVVTVDTSENVETALRRCVSSGHTRLVVTEDDNRDRVKGIVHANQLAQLLLAEGPEATLDGLAREIPIVPETKPLDDLLADLQRQRSLAGGRDRRVRPHGRDRHRRGHHRGGRRRDRRRDRPAGRRGQKTGQRRLVRARPRRDHRPDRLRARAAGGHRRLQLGRRLRLRRAGAASQARRHGHAQRLFDPCGVRS